MDITELAVLDEQFPLRLMQLGFRLIQVVNAMGRDQFRYMLPPICEVPAGLFLMAVTRSMIPTQTTMNCPNMRS